MNLINVSRINLSPETVDCIVFWSKNPQPLLKHFDVINRYNYYFHFTLTPYDSTIEMNLPPKIELIDTFRKLSDKVGLEKVIWRYDPVFYTDKYNYKTHLNAFEKTARMLSGYTRRCMYSFLTVYKKCERNMKGISFSRPSEEDILSLSESFSAIASDSRIALQTCAEDIDLRRYGIQKGKCIDDNLISRISGKKLSLPKDRNQRQECLCVPSIDIGAYNTCTHLCLYCYANYEHNKAHNNFKNHNSDSELISGVLTGNEIIRERQNNLKNIDQLKLFD